MLSPFEDSFDSFYNNLSPQVRDIIEKTKVFAADLSVYKVGTEHILYILLKNGDKTIERILQNLGIDVEYLLSDLEQKIYETSGSAFSRKKGLTFSISKFDTTLDKNVISAIKRSVQIASKMGYEQAEVEHLLLALVEVEGGASKIMKEYGVEIDIFEYFKGQGGDFVSHNLHWAYGPHQQTSGSFLSKVSGIGEGFHTFAVKWTPEKYAFYVDRIKYYEYKNAISHIEESIILSFEPCGEEGLKTAVLPDTFTVDYVRVYKKK